MAKWEYCLMKQHNVQEFWICHPNGRKEKLKGNPHTLASVLAQLGDAGWESAGFKACDDALDNTQTFTMWPGNMGATLLFYFKRQKG